MSKKSFRIRQVGEIDFDGERINGVILEGDIEAIREAAGLMFNEGPLILVPEKPHAAAPEILEALERLLAAAEMTTFSDQFPQECENARAALSKATGGE